MANLGMERKLEWINIEKSLLKIGLFAELPEHELALVNESLEIRRYQKGSTLFWEGDEAKGLHYIKSGAVQMSKTTQDGKQHILHIFGPGEVLAEAVLFTDQPYPATAEAVEDSVIWFLAAGSMNDLVLKHPQIGLYIIRVLSRRLVVAQERLKTWAFTDAPSRVANSLLELADKHGGQDVCGVAIDMEMTHARLAALAGLTRETVSRVLSSLRSEGLVCTKGKTIILRDVDALRERCGE